MNGMDSAGAQLDWFGVPVKAAEIPVWTARMKMLARKVRFVRPALCAAVLAASLRMSLLIMGSFAWLAVAHIAILPDEAGA